MHECEEKSSKVDNNRILVVDECEIAGDGCECVEKDGGHHLYE